MEYPDQGYRYVGAAIVGNGTSSADLTAVNAALSSLSSTLNTAGNANVSAISGSLSATSSTLNAVSSNLSNISTNLSSVSSTLAAVAANVASNTNLSAISNNLSSVSASITSIANVNTNLSTLSSGLNGISGSISSVSSSLNLISSNIDFISSSVSLISSSLSNVSGNLSNTSSTLSSLQVNFIKHIEADKINLLYRGMKPNNATAAVVTANTQILQAAIDESVATGIGITGVNGLFSIAEVTYNGAFSIYGEHMTKSGFKAMSADKILFSARNDCQSTIGLTLSNLYFEGVNSNRLGWDYAFKGRITPVLTANEGGAVATAANRHIFIEKCQFKWFGAYPIHLTDSFNCAIRDNYFLYNGKIPTGAAQFTSAPTPIYADGGIGSLGGALFINEENWGDVGTTGLDVSNCYFGGNNIGSFGGKEVKDQNIGVNFTNCIFEANNYGRYGARTSRESFNNCYFEGNLIKGAKGGAGMGYNCYQYPITENTTDAFDYYTFVNYGFTKTQIISDGVVVFEVAYSDTQQQVTELKAKEGAIKIGTFGNARLYSGQGSPEGSVTAGSGSEYVNTDATTLAALKYFKTTPTGNTGWVSIASASSTGVEVISAPSNNGTYTVLSVLPEVHVFFDTTTAIQNFAITLPTATLNGQTVYVHTKGGGSISNLTVNGSGATVYGAPFAIREHHTLSFVKNTNDPSWYLNDTVIKFVTASIPNQIGVAGEYEILVGTVDQYSGVKITQTTPNINFKMPTPSGSFEKLFIIENSVSSTTSITAYGVTIQPDTFATFFFNGFTWLAQTSKNNKVYQYHTAGASVTINKNTDILVIDPSAVLAALAITLDDRLVKNDKRIDIIFGGSIAQNLPVVTALSIVAPAGQSLLQNLTMTTANSGNTLSYIYNPQNLKHIRLN
jgi:hypothetical protein